MNSIYTKKVSLLLKILPEIEKIDQFALHGGTAINLFYHNMPRLSVDIDLTYIPYSKRVKDLETIGLLLKQLSGRLGRIIPGLSVRIGNEQAEGVKLFCILNGTMVKIEVNTINRGIMDKTQRMMLCDAAQLEFNTFCEMNIVPKGQLFGGKIVAALDRQHPRDLFDINKMFTTQMWDEQITKGFLFSLFSSKRPFQELFKPHFLNHDKLIETQFAGMTEELFTKVMYEQTRVKLLDNILKALSLDQKNMIISVAKGEPDWIYEDWSNYPGIAWKLINIEKLRKKNFTKYQQQIDQLEAILH